ncbi:MAG: FHA domain-containing protein [Betaproteobacteria bacterium]|nr:FHA domain-containing protein [Betaproteobacteria bacterium]
MSAAQNPSIDPWWLEIRGPDAAVHTRLRLGGASLSVGRGYGNDLVIDDAYVSPAHARLTRDDDSQWWIEDLGSDNGTLDARTGAPVTRAALFDRASFTLGRTVLEVRHGASPVAPTLKLPASTAGATLPAAAATRQLQTLGAQAAALMLLAVLLSAVSIWMKQTGEPKLTNYVYGAVLLPLMVMGWAGAWALVTRILTHRAHFARHLRIASLSLLFLIFSEALFKTIDYAFAWVSASSAENVVNWVAAAVMITAHVRVIVPQRLGLIAGVAGVLALAALGLDMSMKSDRLKYQPPTIITSLLPPVFPTKPPVSGDALFERIGALKAELDEERRKDPPAGFNALGDSD